MQRTTCPNEKPAFSPVLTTRWKNQFASVKSSRITSKRGGSSSPSSSNWHGAGESARDPFEKDRRVITAPLLHLLVRIEHAELATHFFEINMHRDDKVLVHV